jgi:hypothetical protein
MVFSLVMHLILKHIVCSILKLTKSWRLVFECAGDDELGEEIFEGEITSRRGPPRQVQVDHPASRIINNMNERTTWSRVRNNSHFAHAAFVATFEPKDIGHTLSDHNWVNSMHEELENFEKNQVWELVDPPPGCKPIGTKMVVEEQRGRER